MSGSVIPAVSRLSVLAGMQLCHGVRLGRLRPSNDAPDAGPRLRIVGDPAEPPAQLKRSRQLALLLEDGADRGGISLSDDEHPGNMVMYGQAGKRDR